MKSDEREILKKDLDWLWRAIGHNPKQLIHIGNQSAMATDGIRFHVINFDDLPDTVNDVECKKPMVDISTPISKSKIKVNPKYLIDALSGFVPSDTGTVVIETMGNDDFYMIRISDTSDKIAFVACVAEK